MLPNGRETAPERINWAPMMGRWNLEDTRRVQFVEAPPVWTSSGVQFGIGILASSIDSFSGGIVEVSVRYADPFPNGPGRVHGAGVILGFRTLDDRFYYCEFGGPRPYSLADYTPGFGFRPLYQAGSSNDGLVPNRNYQLRVELKGQRIKFFVDGVSVVESMLSLQLSGDQIALIAAGPAMVTFESLDVRRSRPIAFVAMKFGDRFDVIWNNVIRDVIEGEGLDALRADDLAGPTPILEDIKRKISDARILIADVTTANPNVFYEIGYADAQDKPLVLLAQKDTDLPFDVSGYRVVFYADEIGGDEALRSQLQNQIRAIMAGERVQTRAST
jgi:hypothetical protein